VTVLLFRQFALREGMGNSYGLKQETEKIDDGGQRFVLDLPNLH
jgi:hypothetical protein